MKKFKKNPREGVIENKRKSLVEIRKENASNTNSVYGLEMNLRRTPNFGEFYIHTQPPTYGPTEPFPGVSPSPSNTTPSAIPNHGQEELRRRWRRGTSSITAEAAGIADTTDNAQSRSFVRLADGREILRTVDSAGFYTYTDPERRISFVATPGTSLGDALRTLESM